MMRIKPNEDDLLEAAKLCLVSGGNDTDTVTEVYEVFFKPYVDASVIDENRVKVWAMARIRYWVSLYDIGFDEERKFLNGILSDVKLLRDMGSIVSRSGKTNVLLFCSDVL